MKRSADTQTEADAADGEQFSTEDAQQEDSLIDATDVVEMPLIQHETFSRTWSTKIANPQTGAVGLKFNKRFLGIIGGLTGCRVELEPDGNTITAKGENNEEINRAMSKLDFIERWDVS